ncbi:hypothetical protein LTR78_005384 [Recurvomyces mirabilis]|uniref:Uncharacterized protein n=1 Tax=Recurvomyces mirabilis TaxID=574656 RepID=A0AAE0WMW7_9PEZI|nr:hypothetical protein LTR78_005384 [Recurvomyces mirabilis]
MGNANSTAQMYWKLTTVLPDVQGHSHGSWFDKSSKPFASEKDREQFIHAVITVLTQNGALNLSNYTIRLLFSRREHDDQVVARIVAQLDGVIRAKLEPDEAGKDQTEAFMALKKDVEIKLERILQAVPDGGDDVEAASAAAGPSRSRQSFTAGFTEGFSGGSGGGNRVVPVEAPPAYEGDVKRKPVKR